MNPNFLSTQMISNQTQKQNKQKDKFISLQSQSLFESNRIAIISAIKMRKNAIQKTNALKSHGSNYKYQIMSNQKNKDIYGDNALRSLNNINTLSYQSRNRFLTLKKQNTQNNSEFFDQKYEKVRVKTQNSLSLTFEKIKDQNKTPLYNEQIQNSYIKNKIRPNFSSIGKIKKNKTEKNSTTSLIRKQQIYETFHQDYQTPNSQLYLGRHKKLALQNKVIDQLLRMKILNSSKSINIQYNKSDYSSMNNSKTSFIMHHTAADEKNIGVTDKKLMQFQEKYKDMVQEYDLKKKLLNQERGDYQHKNQILSQNRQNINFTKIGKIKQNLKETQQSSKQEIKNQTITNIFQESSNIIASNNKKSTFNSKQENLQQKFRLYQQKCNKYQQLSKKTVQLKQKKIEKIQKWLE